MSLLHYKNKQLLWHKFTQKLYLNIHSRMHYEETYIIYTHTNLKIIIPHCQKHMNTCVMFGLRSQGFIFVHLIQDQPKYHQIIPLTKQNKNKIKNNKKIRLNWTVSIPLSHCLLNVKRVFPRTSLLEKIAGIPNLSVHQCQGGKPLCPTRIHFGLAFVDIHCQIKGWIIRCHAASSLIIFPFSEYLPAHWSAHHCRTVWPLCDC